MQGVLFEGADYDPSEGKPIEYVSRKCHCGSSRHYTEQAPPPHYKKGWCVTCYDVGIRQGKIRKVAWADAYRGFIPNPETPKTKRPSSHTDLVAKYGRGFCEMCLRESNQLPRPQTLNAHHVIQYRDGGEPSRENIWILCTHCHRIVHALRDYCNTETEDEQRENSSVDEGLETMGRVEINNTK